MRGGYEFITSSPYVAASPLRGLGSGGVPLLLDSVSCVGSELDLLSCDHDGTYQHSCGGTVAGVVCGGMHSA